MPGVAGQQDERALALAGLAPAALEVGELDAAPDERVAVHGGRQRRRPGRRPPRRRPARPATGRQRAVDGRRLAAQHALEDGHRRRARASCRAPRAAASAAPRTRAAPRPGCPRPRGPPSAAGGRTRGTARRRSPPARPARPRRARARPGAARPRPASPARAAGSSPARGAARPPTRPRRRAGTSAGRSRAPRGRARRRACGRRPPSRPRPSRIAAADASMSTRAVVQVQAQLAAPGEHAVAQRAPQLGQQRAQRRVGRGGRALRPEHVDELVARAASGTVEHEVGEEQAALPPRQPRIQPTPGDVDHDRAAQPDVPALAHL